MKAQNTTVNVMVDLETTGKAPGCGILTIGAVVFDLENPATFKYDTDFYIHVDAESNLDVGLAHDSGTIKWWLEQSKEAYQEAWESPFKQHLAVALNKFSMFLEQLHAEEVIVWANGASFDFPILEAAYKAVDLPYPIEYRNVRCYRTLKNLFPYVKAEEFTDGIKHNAFWDAKYQARHAATLLEWSRRFQKAEAPVWAPV